MSSAPQNKPKKKAPSQSKNPSKQVKKNVVRKAMKQANVMDQVMSAQAQQIVESFASPLDAEAVRLGTVYGSYKTSTAKPFTRITPAWADLQTAGSLDDTCCFVYRDPYCAAIVPQKVSQNTIYQGNFGPITVAGTPSPLYIPYLSFLSGNSIHGPLLFPGRLPDQRLNWFYVGVAQVTINNTGSTSFGVSAMTFRDDVVTQLGNFTIAASGSQSFGPFALGTYFSSNIFSQTASSAAIGTLQVTISAGVVTPAHLALNGIINNSASAEAFKVYAASVMYTNTASPLNRQGKVAGIQLPAGSWWDQYLNFDTIADLESADSRDVVNGIYGFLKPTQPRDIDFIPFDTVSTNNLSTDTWWPLRRPSDFLAVAVKVLASSNGQDGYFTIAHAFEFRTTDPWREVEMAHISPHTVEFAMMLVSRCPQWHENPLHLSDIWNWIKKTSQDVYESVKEALPDIVKGATTVAKIGGAVIPLML